MGAKKKEEVKKTKKGEVLEETMEMLPEQGKLIAVIEALNESGIAEVEFDDEATFEENIENFMQAVESVPGDKEEEIPEDVIEYYNELVDDAEAKAKEELAEKKNKEKPAKTGKDKTKASGEKKEKDPAKVARGKALAASRNNGKETWGGMVKKLIKTTKMSPEEIAKKVTKSFPEGREILARDVKFYISKMKKAGEI